jgi:hypothetical protein
MRPALAFAFLVAFVALLTSCGGDDTSTPTPTATPATGTAHTITATPQSQKTGTPNQQTPSVAATAPGVTPTAPPVAAVGTPAVAPDDQQAFSTSFSGQQVDLSDCIYNPTTAVVNCDSVLYAIDPPIVGQDISCTLWLVAGTPRALACQAAEPPGTTYYKIG